MNTHIVYQEYLSALLAGDRRRALQTARGALAADIDIRDVYMDVFQPAMHEIGRLWEVNEVTVAQEHLATAITQSVMAQIYSPMHLKPPIGRKMVSTCIGGELHEIGIRMITDFFEMEGWDVYYLGANMPVDDVVQMVSEQRADLLAISATLNNHVLRARQLIEAVRSSPAGRWVKIIVGGRPFIQAPDMYMTIGADMTAPNAREAVTQTMTTLIA
ncbi:MAG: hypothetical protein HC837_10065 [Chloroflexaceae bacterium]|nr:hypothetical protein [Chloroflexaceae bacterium]